MIRKAFTYLKEGNTFHALELVETSEGTRWFFTSVKKHKDEIDIAETIEADSRDILAEKVSRNSGVFVLINTNHVLTRVQEAAEGEETAVVNKAFPNLKIADFYYEVIRSGQHMLISICRKEYVDGILAEIGQKANLTGFSLGALQIHMLSGFAEQQDVVISNAVVKFRKPYLEDIKKGEGLSKRSYTINGLEIRSDYLLGFSGILGQVAGRDLSLSNFKSENAHFRNECYHKRFFRLFLQGALAFLFLLLLVNFMVFNHYYQKKEALKQASEVNRLNKQNFMALKEEVGKKEKIIADIQASAGSRSSFYIDRITEALPSSILLKEILYQPLQKQIKEGEEILLQEDRIAISGESADSSLFSEWIETLEGFDWTENVSIREYGSTSSGTAFSILLTLKTDR